MISHENYMERIVDYYDGKLSQSEKDALMVFLEEHPDLYEEFLVFGESMPEAADEESVKAPASLIGRLKDIPENVFVLSEEMLVAYAEGDLDAYTFRQVEKALEQNPERKNDLKIFTAARFEADNAVEFPYKNRLYKKETIAISFRRILYYTSAAAAILLLAFFLRPATVTESGIQSGSHSIAHVTFTSENISGITNGNPENNTGFNSANNNLVALTTGNNSNQDREAFENIAPLAPRVAGPLKEIPVSNTENISDTDNEYLAIYRMIEQKNSVSDDNTMATGTLTAWKDWGKGFLSGKSSVKDTPADITLRDVAEFSFTNISRFATENLALNQKEK
ncbi:hypothetical protein SDC9_72053 [bioreactor metagenome]|uniref:Uncharacterized protein n=1 Tax=bioreactor metagenome TaxID=1076179 RepID=A0A644YBJ9_9ZZZZ